MSERSSFGLRAARDRYSSSARAVEYVHAHTPPSEIVVAIVADASMTPLFLAALGLTVSSSTFRGGYSRREVIALPALSAAAAALPARPALAAAAALPKEYAPVQQLAVKAKKLRASVRTSAANRRSLPFDDTPGVNNYSKQTDAMLRAKKEVLLPLVACRAPRTPCTRRAQIHLHGSLLR